MGENYEQVLVLMRGLYLAVGLCCSWNEVLPLSCGDCYVVILITEISTIAFGKAASLL